MLQNMPGNSNKIQLVSALDGLFLITALNNIDIIIRGVFGGS